MDSEAYKAACFLLLDMLKGWAVELDARPTWSTRELHMRILAIIERVDAAIREDLQRDSGASPGNN